MGDEKPITPSGEHRRRERVVIRDTLTDLEQVQRITDMRTKREDEHFTIKELREDLAIMKHRLDHMTTALRALLNEKP
jgi:hypothetical protein